MTSVASNQPTPPESRESSATGDSPTYGPNSTASSQYCRLRMGSPRQRGQGHGAPSGTWGLAGHRATCRTRRLPCPRAIPSAIQGVGLRCPRPTIAATQPWQPTPCPPGPPIDQSSRTPRNSCRRQSRRCPTMYRVSDSDCRSRDATRLRYLEPLSADSEQAPTWRARMVRFRRVEPRESNGPL